MTSQWEYAKKTFSRSRSLTYNTQNIPGCQAVGAGTTEYPTRVRPTTTGVERIQGWMIHRQLVEFAVPSHMLRARRPIISV